MQRPNFRKVNTCRQCRFVEEVEDYEPGIECFCNIDCSKRPLCGSLLMGEDFDENPRAEGKEYAAWKAWSRGREVDDDICDRFEPRENDEN